jgi:hypothetical protein
MSLPLLTRAALRLPDDAAAPHNPPAPPAPPALALSAHTDPHEHLVALAYGGAEIPALRAQGVN